MTTSERVNGEFQLVPLSEQQREAYPNVIYQEASNSDDDRMVLLATIAAANNSGLKVVADLERDGETGLQGAVIRSAATERYDHRAESALMHGTIRAIGLRVEEQHGQGAEVNLPEAAREMSAAFINQITGNSEMWDTFRGYYGGLRWGTDQEKFTGGLFAQSAEFDPEVLDATLTGSDVISLVHGLDLDIPYETYKNWYDLPAEEIFAQKPELDYRKLEDADFRATPEGQTLEEAYKRRIGSNIAQSYQRYPRPTDDNGVVIPKPLVPFSKFPVIEALMIDEVSLSKPTAKYDFGPRDVTELITGSDSYPAIASLVETVTTRLPKGDRHVFDGPSEFQHKAFDIRALISTYNNSEHDRPRQEVFRDHILTVLQAYTGNGSIAHSVRSEYEASRRPGDDYLPREIGDVKDVASVILTRMLASADGEVFAARYFDEDEAGLVIRQDQDVLGFSANQLKEILIDSLGYVGVGSHPELFKRLGNRIFKDEAIADRLAEIVRLRILADELRHTPEVLMARKGLGPFSFSSLDNKKPEEVLARENFDKALAPSESASLEARTKQNELLFDLLESLAESGQLEDDRYIGRFFDDLVSKINIGSSFDMTELPKEYERLMHLAERPDVPVGQKSHILWQLVQKFDHAGEKLAPELLQIVMDGYRIMLGELGSIQLPEDDVSHGLDALNHLASHNKIFKHASEEQLLTLRRYKLELVDVIQRALAGALPSADEAQLEDGETYEEWKSKFMNNARYLANSVTRLEKIYAEYLHIEDVKVHPHIYYPWLIEKLSPFWNKMQWEVGPGNRPKRDIQALHDVLRDHVQNRLVLKEDDYPEDFDVLNEGHLDTLLLECYERMIVPHDIKYNTTVWQDGMTFVHYAFAYMPPKLIEQLKAKHGGDSQYAQLINYIEREHARWNKEEDQ